MNLRKVQDTITILVVVGFFLGGILSLAQDTRSLGQTAMGYWFILIAIGAALFGWFILPRLSGKI